MTVEYDSLMNKNTWSLVPLPPGNNLVGFKWIYKAKFTTKGQIEKYKARLVENGFSQQEGIDYNESLAPIAKMNTIRTIISLVASYQWEIHQMYVKSTFFNGDICEDIYMHQPHGFITTETSHLV